MRGLAAFTLGCAIVAALSTLDPSLARWIVSAAFWGALALLGASWVAGRRT